MDSRYHAERSEESCFLFEQTPYQEGDPEIACQARSIYYVAVV
jgi:hypothetical protein